MHPSRTDDWIIVKRASAGDRQAISELYDAYADEIFDFCLRITGHAESAADATLAGFTRAIDALRRQPLDTLNIRIYLLTAARSEAFDILARSAGALTAAAKAYSVPLDPFREASRSVVAGSGRMRAPALDCSRDASIAPPLRALAGFQNTPLPSADQAVTRSDLDNPIADSRRWGLPVFEPRPALGAAAAVFVLLAVYAATSLGFWGGGNPSQRLADTGGSSATVAGSGGPAIPSDSPARAVLASAQIRSAGQSDSAGERINPATPRARARHRGDAAPRAESAPRQAPDNPRSDASAPSKSPGSEPATTSPAPTADPPASQAPAPAVELPDADVCAAGACISAKPSASSLSVDLGIS